MRKILKDGGITERTMGVEGMRGRMEAALADLKTAGKTDDEIDVLFGTDDFVDYLLPEYDALGAGLDEYDEAYEDLGIGTI